MTKRSGFTIIELMVTIAVLGILITIAAPSFLNLLRDSQRSSAVNDLLADLTFARSEAARRGRVVGVCSNVPSTGDTCGTNAQWGDGWLVFEDTDSSGSITGTETVIRRAEKRAGSMTVAANQAYFRVRPFNQRTPDPGRVVFCDPRGAAQSRAVIVSPSGRPRVDTVTSCTP